MGAAQIKENSKTQEEFSLGELNTILQYNRGGPKKKRNKKAHYLGTDTKQNYMGLSTPNPGETRQKKTTCNEMTLYQFLTLILAQFLPHSLSASTTQKHRMTR